LDFGEGAKGKREGKGRCRKVGRENKEKVRGGKGKREGRGREEFCAVVIFLSGNPGSLLFINCIV